MVGRFAESEPEQVRPQSRPAPVPARAESHAAPPQLLHLQRAAGNAAVARLLARQSGGDQELAAPAGDTSRQVGAAMDGHACGPAPAIAVQRALRAQKTWNPFDRPAVFFTAVQAALTTLTGPDALAFTPSGMVRQRLDVTLGAPEARALASAPVAGGGSGHAHGMALVERIVNSDKEIVIHDSAGNTAAPRIEPPRDARATMVAAATPGVGTNVDVHWNHRIGQEHPGSEVPVTDGAGDAVRQGTPEYIALGHELGHGDRASRGVGAYDVETGGNILSSHNRVPAKGGRTLSAAREEIYNIGLPPAPDTPVNPDALTITENDLRNEHHLAERVGYTSA